MLFRSDQGFETARRTSQEEVTTSTQVYLGDTMGEMLVLMGAADICFMGGSLIGDKVGGHNVLEPAALGVPIITGPSYFNFQEIVDKMVSFSAIAITSNASTLAIEIKDLIQNESAYHQVKVSLLSVVNSNQGSLQKTLDKVTL